jgi:protein-S-isoprenylcysteine O-methyltransferase Ste14
MMSEPDTPGMVVRPPILYLGTLIAGLVVDAIWPAALFGGAMSAAPRTMVGLLMFATGVAVVSSAIRRLARAGTGVRAHQTTTIIVSDGVYAYSRNPIYVGLTMIYLGIAVAADNLWLVILLIPVLTVLRYGVIAREERYLERKFGGQYLAYKARVRRWV